VTTHLYLIRHGDAVEGLEDGKYRDLGLSDEGRRQSELLRDRVTRTGELKPDVFVASTMRRAQETAAILAPALGASVTHDADFEEWRGDDGTVDPDEFMIRWNAVPDDQKAYFRWQEGYENRLEFMLRVHLTLNRVLQEHVGKTIVAVTHGAFIQLSFVYFFGYGEAVLARAVPEVRRTSITHWMKAENEKRWTLERSNDYQHLL
jgi:2,3-bisphosphoglycerate-dependent phosphoglycerate mutase